MIHALVDFLLGCSHHKQTRPFTVDRRCYTVCLECGKELPYSSAAMRPLTRSERANTPTRSSEELAAVPAGTKAA